MDSLIEFDTWLLLLINGFNHEFVDPIAKAFSGRGIWIPLYVTIAGIMIWKFGWRKGLLIIAAAGIAVGASDYVCASVIRPFVQRMRPSNLDNPISEFVHVVDEYRSGRYGFPSCHAANTFALAVFTSLVLKWRGYTAFIFGWAVLQCYSRVYLGVHFPGDLAVGALAGTLLAYIVYLICKKYVLHSAEINTKSKPTPVYIVGALTCLYMIIMAIIKH